jgi:uncharacterized membrane-anchored protein
MNSDQNSNETRVIIESKSTVAGIMALIIGFIGVFILSFILSPLALILGIVALFQGGTSNIVTGVIGIVLAFRGAMTSPTLLRLLGIGSLLAL